MFTWYADLNLVWASKSNKHVDQMKARIGLKFKSMVEVDRVSDQIKESTSDLGDQPLEPYVFSVLDAVVDADQRNSIIQSKLFCASSFLNLWFRQTPTVHASLILARE